MTTLSELRLAFVTFVASHADWFPARPSFPAGNIAALWIDDRPGAYALSDVLVLFIPEWTVADINRAVEAVWEDDRPLILATGPIAGGGSEEELLDTLLSKDYTIWEFTNDGSVTEW